MSNENIGEIGLKSSLRGSIIEELFTNSIHFPLANIILELLLPSNMAYWRKPDPYLIIGACLVQAYVLGRWKYHGKGRRFVGNLVGPALYTVCEVLIEGPEFFDSPNHLAYWIFALMIGIVQAQEQTPIRLKKQVCILSEHLVRTQILFVMYWIFETSSDGLAASILTPSALRAFFSDPSHVYIGIVTMLLGGVVGSAHITANHYLEILKQAAAMLHTYSEWFLGREILSQAIQDASVLSLRRQKRTVLFMDIRGFTGWSESKSPEEVVSMLNAYFDMAEKLLDPQEVIKLKYTADEILAVFAQAEHALRAAFRIRASIGSYLRSFGLSAGIGLHTGPLVEGLIGSTRVKAYDIIGDTVNTGKRICDNADGGEILLSETCYAALRQSIITLPPKSLQLKGKHGTFLVYPVTDLPDDA